MQWQEKENTEYCNSRTVSREMTKFFYMTFFLLVILCTANIWHAFDMNEDIVTQKFLAQKILQTKLM